MASLVFPRNAGEDLFANYKPSKNAHVDIISAIPSGSSGSGTASGKVVRTFQLTLKARTSEPNSKDLLSSLLPSIPVILAGKRPEQSYHHLSAACHRLVLPPHNLGPTIYTRVHEELTKSIAALAREWRGSIMSRETGWLGNLTTGWKLWQERVEMLSAILVYLDRVYSNDTSGIASIQELAIATFRKGIWENELLYQKTRDDVLSWAAGEREAGQKDQAQRVSIRAVSDLAKVLSTFPSITEPYLEAVDAHYASQAIIKLDSVEAGQMSATNYVDWAMCKVDEEFAKCSECLDEAVGWLAVDITRREVGTKMQERIVRRALDEAMNLADSKALSCLYRFSVDAKAFMAFSQALQAYIEARLRKLISNPENDPQMIDETLKLKRFTDQTVASLFRRNNVVDGPKATPLKADVRSGPVPPESEKKVRSLQVPSPIGQEQGGGTEDGDIAEEQEPAQDEPGMGTAADKQAEEAGVVPDEEEDQAPRSALDAERQLELQDAVRSGFKAGMGSRQNAPAEWIAKHLDSVMRRGQGSGTESAFNAQLDEIIALIGFTRDKDVFKAFYSTQLAKRLLLNKSASDDMERNMIIKLQKEMGEEFTTGDVMMKDLGLSETLVKAYQSHLAKSLSSSDPTNLSANVLTESAWPAYPLLKDGWAFKLTPELQGSIDDFTKWYANQHKNRQLSWRWQLATVTLTGRFGATGGSRYEIGVSLFQAVVLLQFNEVDELDFKEIKERTGIETSELVRTLQSLSLGRKGTRVLLKKPAVKEVLPTDTFKYAKSFTSDRIKFRINQIQQDMSAEESKKTNEQVAIDRVSVLEATIVRIMKGKKKATMAQLVDQVVGDVSKRFPPDVKEIKKRVESLIEREFLMRDEEDRNLLHYLA